MSNHLRYVKARFCVPKSGLREKYMSFFYVFSFYVKCHKQALSNYSFYVVTSNHVLLCKGSLLIAQK
jgi:hypothetical protein